MDGEWVEGVTRYHLIPVVLEPFLSDTILFSYSLYVISMYVWPGTVITWGRLRDAILSSLNKLIGVLETVRNIRKLRLEILKEAQCYRNY